MATTQWSIMKGISTLEYICSRLVGSDPYLYVICMLGLECVRPMAKMLMRQMFVTMYIGKALILSISAMIVALKMTSLHT